MIVIQFYISLFSTDKDDCAEGEFICCYGSYYTFNLLPQIKTSVLKVNTHAGGTQIAATYPMAKDTIAYVD